MSLFGTKQGEASKNLADVFPPGTPFRMVGAELQGLTGEPGAQKLLATIRVSPVEHHEHLMDFGVWGSLADQITQLEAGELPAIVTLTDQSGVWAFAPHGPQGTVEIAQPDGSVDEVPRRVDVQAHMVPDAATDSTLPSFTTERPAPPEPEVPEGGHKTPVSVEPPSVKPTEIDDSQTFDPGAKQ